ncbi:hypothetical protein, partial [Lacticaseibacillus paracasei]|uniref:hypothetical protein n=1 Tax=Lacticaseibacillus paracasei TaxID=1597 RepID=UPI001CDAAC9A
RDGTLDVGHDVPFLCAWLLIRIGHHGLFGLFNYVLHLDCKRGSFIFYLLGSLLPSFPIPARIY